jgi:hypothetical protein
MAASSRPPSGSRDECAAAQDQDVETLWTILGFYEFYENADKPTNRPLSLFGYQALGRIVERLARV